MQDINKKIVIFTIIAVILIGTISFLFIYRAKTIANEPLVGIDGVSFTLNNIKDNFLNSDYAKDNKCTTTVSEESLNIKCQKNSYEFVFNGSELTMESHNEESKNIFKYVVNSIAELQGYNSGEYLESIDKFLVGEFIINGLEYTKNNQNTNYKINLTKKFEKYTQESIIDTVAITNIDDSLHKYELQGYKLHDVRIIKSDIINSMICTGAVAQNDEYNVDLTVNYYDINNNLVASQTVNLNKYKTYGNPYLGFDLTLEISNKEAYDSIVKYSISLSE